MVYWLLAVIAALLIITCSLGIKIYLLQKSIDEIETKFGERLETDTNTLIDVSCRDRHILSLAGSINKQLRILRKERQQFQQGDTELKNAVTGISHDLRTPLTAITGYLHMLEKEDKSETAEKYLQIISERCEALKQLTEELFRYSVILAENKELKTEEIILNHAVEESLAGYYAVLVGRKINPDIRIPEAPVKCMGDKAALTRIFSNILNNAVKYSDGDLHVELKENGEIIFENTAENLDEIQTGRLFDRFYTVEAARNSTGLGLSISKALIEKMNGEILAEYKNNKLKIILKFHTVSA